MKLHAMSKTTRRNTLTYGLVILAYVVLQFLGSDLLRPGGVLSYSLSGQLVPICAYVVMALSLNLTVGVLGELSLGHAGFSPVDRCSTEADALLGRSVMKWGADGELSALDLQLILSRLSCVDEQAAGLMDCPMDPC